MKKKIFTVLLAMFVAAGNVFADKESDAFLKKLTCETKVNNPLLGEDVDMSVSYEKKVFTITLTMAGSSLAGYEGMVDQILGSLVNNDDMLKLEALGFERSHKGFVANMIKSNAKLKRVVNVTGMGKSLECVMKAKDLKALNLADTANVDRMQLDIYLRTMNTILPAPINDEMTLCSMNMSGKNLVMNMLLDEGKVSLEKIESMKDVLVGFTVTNMMRSDMFARYAEVFKANELDFVMRIKGAGSGRSIDITLPTSRANELFDPNNPIDSVDVKLTAVVYGTKKILPSVVSEAETLIDMEYGDKTLTYIHDVTGVLAKRIHDFDKINKLELVVGCREFAEEMKKEWLKLGDIKMRYVYRNAAWDKDIVYEEGLKELLRRSGNEYYRDSANIARIAEMANIDMEGSEKIKEAHSFDGNVYTMHLLLQKKNLAPITIFQNLSKNDFIRMLKNDYSNLSDLLYRRKKNVVIHAKNIVTGQEESITIPYTSLQ